jgi:hypothetical protein
MRRIGFEWRAWNKCAPFDAGEIGLILIGMPGLEKRLARYPQFYSRIGFVDEFRPLSATQVRQLLEQYWMPAGVKLPQQPWAEEAIAAVIRITSGNLQILSSRRLPRSLRARRRRFSGSPSTKQRNASRLPSFSAPESGVKMSQNITLFRIVPSGDGSGADILPDNRKLQWIGYARGAARRIPGSSRNYDQTDDSITRDCEGHARRYILLLCGRLLSYQERDLVDQDRACLEQLLGLANRLLNTLLISARSLGEPRRTNSIMFSPLC